MNNCEKCNHLRVNANGELKCNMYEEATPVQFEVGDIVDDRGNIGRITEIIQLYRCKNIVMDNLLSTGPQWTADERKLKMVCSRRKLVEFVKSMDGIAEVNVDKKGLFLHVDFKDMDKISIEK